MPILLVTFDMLQTLVKNLLGTKTHTKYCWEVSFVCPNDSKIPSPLVQMSSYTLSPLTFFTLLPSCQGLGKVKGPLGSWAWTGARALEATKARFPVKLWTMFQTQRWEMLCLLYLHVPCKGGGRVTLRSSQFCGLINLTDLCAAPSFEEYIRSCDE